MTSRREAAARGGAIYRPAADGWQKWSEDADGVWALRGEAPELPDLQPETGGLIAVPARRAFSLAVWLPADDPEIFRDLVLTQLEIRGLAGRSREAASFSWEEITRADNQVLMHVTVLPAHLAPGCWHDEVVDYVVSPSCLPLDSDALTIWREHGAWIAAVTRGGRLLHFQALAEQEPGASMALEIWMMLSPLEAGNMIEGEPPVVFYRQAGDPLDLSAWNESATSPALVRDFPPPVRPNVSLPPAPLAVRNLQAQKIKSARQQRLMFAAAFAYLALVLLLAGYTFRLHWQARKLQAEINRDAPAVAATKEAMDQWNILQPAIEPSAYPVEILHQVARLLPKDGVRLTLFETSLNRVLIQGEASTLAAALKFQDDLKKNTDLEALFDWDAEGPKQLPNGSTRFQIDGTRRGSVAQNDDESSDT